MRADLAAGRSVAVWFTAAAVGVPTGGSARVVAVGDSAEGDFVQVRPAGSRDTMFCAPNELTRTRPARRRAAPPVEKAAAVPALENAAPPVPRPVEARPTVPPPARARRRTERSGEISVALTATADGEWSVEVIVDTKRVVRAVPVPAADVAAAARSLPPAVTEAIEASLAGARRRQSDRVEQLRAELDAAQKVLDQLARTT